VYLTYNNGNYTAWPSEGGHCEFAPRTQLEIELLQVRQPHAALKKAAF
jgi:glucokinase